MRHERSDHTLQPTALVHEAFLSLIRQENIAWQSRSQFLAVASNAMRRVLVDCARARHSQKRGDGVVRVDFDPDQLGEVDSLDYILALDESLQRLREHDPRAAEVVEMHFFGGLTLAEVGEVLGVNERTVKRDWRLARAWLNKDLNGNSEVSPE